MQERIGLLKDENIIIADKLNKAGKANRIFDWAKPKAYRLEHLTEFYLSFFGLGVCAAISIYFSHFTLVKFSETSYVILAQVVSVIILLFTYFAEYSNITQISRIKTINAKHDGEKMPISLMRWVGAGALSLINIALIFSGVYYQTLQSDKTISVVSSTFTSDSMHIAKEFNGQIVEYNTKILDVKKSYINPKTGELDYKGRKMIYIYDTKIIDLRHEKDSALTMFKESKKTGLNVVKADLNQFIWLKVLASIILELIVLATIIFIGHYKAMVYIWEKKEMEKNEAKLIKDRDLNRAINTNTSLEMANFMEMVKKLASNEKKTLN